MQVSIDRVVRSFGFRHSFSLAPQMPDRPSVKTADEASDFAARLLDNYKGQLAVRNARSD